MTIRPRRGGYQVIVYAGIDPVTGRQRQIARQVKGKREAERLEAKLRAEVADGRHRGTSARTVGELLDVYLYASGYASPYARPYAGHPRTPSLARRSIPAGHSPEGGVVRPRRADALRAIDPSAQPRSWRTLRPAPPTAISLTWLPRRVML